MKMGDMAKTSCNKVVRTSCSLINLYNCLLTLKNIIFRKRDIETAVLKTMNDAIVGIN